MRSLFLSLIDWVVLQRYLKVLSVYEQVRNLISNLRTARIQGRQSVVSLHTSIASSDSSDHLASHLKVSTLNYHKTMTDRQGFVSPVSPVSPVWRPVSQAGRWATLTGAALTLPQVNIYKLRFVISSSVESVETCPAFHCVEMMAVQGSTPN